MGYWSKMVRDDDEEERPAEDAGLTVVPLVQRGVVDSLIRLLDEITVFKVVLVWCDGGRSDYSS